MKILFIGASGMLGKPVARELAGAGFDLTLLARNPEKLQAIFPGTRTVQGDVLDTASLRNAMEGMDAVYCNLSILPATTEKDPQTEREGIDAILAAAKATGLKRIAYISSLVHRYEGMNEFHWWAFRIKHRALQQIKESGIPYTIFYPSTFMETFPYQMLRGNKIAMLGNSVAPMWFIAAEDFGRQVAQSFRLFNSGNREYSIQGPEPFTFGEANHVFAAHYKKAKLGRLKVPAGLMKFLGVFSPTFNYTWHICEALNNYPEKFESEQTWKELGKPGITLAAFAAGL